MAILNSIKRLFKREIHVSNITGDLTRINVYADDNHPVVLFFSMEYSDGDKQTFRLSLDCSDAEFLIRRIQYLLSGISKIDGIGFDD